MTHDQAKDIQELLELPVEKRPQRIAELVHRLQVDKAGKPYIGHPRRVAENVQLFPKFKKLTKQERADVIAAAWLHDVIEDSGNEAWPKVTAEDLLSWGINLDVVNIVLRLTRIPEKEDPTREYYNPNFYYDFIVPSPTARLVKLADITDNCNVQRIMWVEQAGGKRNPEKYEHALKQLKITEKEDDVFWWRTNQACERGTLTEESQFTFGVIYSKDDKPLRLYCNNKGMEHWEFDQKTNTWFHGADMFEFIVHGLEDFEIVAKQYAAETFPGAFPMVLR